MFYFRILYRIPRSYDLENLVTSFVSCFISVFPAGLAVGEIVEQLSFAVLTELTLLFKVNLPQNGLFRVWAPQITMVASRVVSINPRSI